MTLIDFYVLSRDVAGAISRLKAGIVSDESSEELELLTSRLKKACDVLSKASCKDAGRHEVREGAKLIEEGRRLVFAVKARRMEEEFPRLHSDTTKPSAKRKGAKSEQRMIAHPIGSYPIMGLSFGETVTVAILTAGSTSLLSWVGHYIVAYFQRNNETARFRRERLFEQYIELMATAGADLERAMMLHSCAMFGTTDLPILQHLDELRHKYRGEMMRLSLQIRLLEEDQKIAAMVKHLARSQPFQPLLIPPRFGDENYNKLFGAHQEQMDRFEGMINTILDAFVLHYAKKNVRDLIATRLQSARTFVQETFRSGPKAPR